MSEERLALALKILNAHHESFFDAKPFADLTDQHVPCDTKAWSQILVCALTGMKGRARKKGSDLSDGSDVKAANLWSAIDTPRFNGSIPSGRKTKTSKKASDISALDDMPYLFFVLWDERPSDRHARCRVWCVRPPEDKAFRTMAAEWYRRRNDGTIKSDNFQLHPPRNKDNNVFRNECGNLSYPLVLSVVWNGKAYDEQTYKPQTIDSGVCEKQ